MRKHFFLAFLIFLLLGAVLSFRNSFWVLPALAKNVEEPAAEAPKQASKKDTETQTAEAQNKVPEQQVEEWSLYYPQHGDFIILMPEKVTLTQISDLPEETIYRGTASSTECVLIRMRAPDKGEAGFEDFCNGFIDGQVDSLAKATSLAREKVTATKTTSKGKGWHGQIISYEIDGQPATTSVIALTNAGPFVYCVSVSKPKNSPLTQEILQSFKINESKVKGYIKLINSLRL